MLFQIVFPCLWLLCSLSEFYQETDEIRKLIEYEFDGFASIRNEGPFNSCCGVKIDDICADCIYVISAVIKDESGKDIKKFPLATTKTASKSLFEKSKFRHFFDFSQSKRFTTRFEISNKNKVIDVSPIIDINFSDHFTFHMTIGTSGRMYFYGFIRIVDIYSGIKFFGHWIRIDSIYWHRDKILAVYNQKNTCKDFSIEKIKAKIMSDDYINFLEHEIVSFNSFGCFLFSQSEAIRQNMFNTKLIISFDHNNISDEINLKELSNFPNIIETVKSIKSNKGLLTINISFKHLCNGYFGKNCQNECFAIPGVSICDDITGKMWCLGPNGRLKCQNNIENCPVYEQKNENCIGVNDDKICLCDYSFNGPLQRNFVCDNECNGVGTCVGPNRCVCIFPYFGDLCDEYPCEDDLEDHCYNNGLCIYKKNEIMCSCPHPLVKGLLCEDVSCQETCEFGTCVYSKKINTTECACKFNYYGEKCDIKVYDENDLSFYVYLLSTGLISIALFLFFGIIKMIIRQNNKTKFTRL